MKKRSNSDNNSGRGVSTGSFNSSNPLDCLAEAALAVGNADHRKTLTSLLPLPLPSSPPRNIAIGNSSVRIISHPADMEDAMSPVSVSSVSVEDSTTPPRNGQRQRPRPVFTFNRKDAMNQQSSLAPRAQQKVIAQCRDDEQVAYAVSKRGMKERRADKPYSCWHICQPPPGIFMTVTTTGNLSVSPVLVSPAIQPRQQSHNYCTSNSDHGEISPVSSKQAQGSVVDFAVSKKRKRREPPKSS